MNSSKIYVLIPVMPTPNGPLHLGHVAGPFLKMDVLARHLRRKGEKVALVSATDPYETHVLPRSDHERKPVEVVCAENHRAINECLKALNIQYDEFINPLESPYRTRLREVTRGLLGELSDQGLLHSIEEAVHRSAETNRIIAGSRIEGKCPCCGTDMGGYHCEACGMEVSPADLIDPHAEPFDASIEVGQRSSVFMQANTEAISQRMLELRVPGDIRRIAERYLKTSGGRVRLSNPGEWGEPWPDALASSQSVVFTYTALFMLSILCGEVAQSKLGLQMNPFDADSTTLNITSFGFDNTVPFCVGVETLAQNSVAWRGFDRYLTNFFYTLDGKKFSTSRRHCIWADQAVGDLNTSSDVLRYFLAKTSPEAAAGDFSRAVFETFRDTIDAKISGMRVVLMSGEHSNVQDPYADVLVRLIAEMDAALDVDHFNLRAAAVCIDRWLAQTWQRDSVRQYVRGFCVLAYPIMPDVALELWGRMGYSGLPHCEGVATVAEAA